MVKRLEDVLAHINEQEEEVVKAPFVVNNLETAAEATRRITYFHERMTELDSIMEKQIAPFLEKIELIKNWNSEAKQEYLDKVEHYSILLELFMRKEVEAQEQSGKKPKKSINLPYGKIALKKQQPEFEKDEDILFNYAKERELVRTKESTDWATLKKECTVVNGRLVDPNGEIVPGVIVMERDDKFEVKLND